MRFPPIRRYLALIVLAAFLPGVLAAAYLLVHDIRQSEESAWVRAEHRAQFLLDALDAQLDVMASTLELLSRHPALEGGDLAAFHRFAGTAIEGTPIEFVALLRPTTAEMLLNTRRPFGAQLPQSLVPGLEAYAARPEISISPVVKGAVSGQFVFLMVKPVEIGGERLLLTLGASVTQLARLIDHTPEAWVTAIFDRDGRIAVRRPHMPELVGGFALQSIRDAIGQNDQGRTRIKGRGGEAVIAYRRSARWGWVVTAGLQADNFERDIRRDALLLAVIALLLLVPGLALAVWLGARLAAGARSLSRAAQFMGETGGAPPALPPMPCAELAELGERLELSAREIAARDAALRQERDNVRAQRDELRIKTLELERSNADLEQFAHISSHDLREPMRTIACFVGILERKLAGRLDEETAQQFEFVRSGAMRMDRMILDLLDYSSIGRPHPPEAAAASGHVLEQVVGLLNLDERTVVIERPGTFPALRVHAGDLDQLFTNLLGNAVKYRAPDRPLRIHVRCDVAERFATFSVADNGIGIDPAYHARIFDIFQRLHGREVEGTGIGLAICRRVVEHYGGTIRVDSVPGQGSTFTFTLPLEPVTPAG
ncbi:ATP-binding protein [Magnetospirillum sp. UT-4]|uniref:sensor histidine kinase n=1 Tax=Magnetospirillum sp. UT-4 TaxID=2681467 RepID=UPI001383FFF0|nr:ATP-binding protein [Magnetospirillum sp. UT-4]CAA7627047.1 putative Sensor histidine kinase [Magnetospirillum sp. UT-4]